MKRLNFSTLMRPLVGVGCVVAGLLLTSCYSSTVSVGELKPNDPVVCVATTHEAHFLGGLIGSPKREAKNYVGTNENYRFKQYVSFADGLLNSVTFGIYSPTTTKYYLPYGAAAVPAFKESIPITFGIRGGLNFSSLSGDDAFDETGTKSGINLGIIFDIPITSEIYFQPGLYYSVKGASDMVVKTHSKSNWTTNKEDLDMKFVEIPLLVSYHYDVKEDVQLQGAIGPYVAYGISSDLFDDNVLSNPDNRLDAGLRLEVGAVYQKHYYAGLGYESGLKDLGSEINARSTNFFINIGYNF